MKRHLVIVVTVDDQTVDPTTTDPHELADYFLDHECDDPTFELKSAEWDTNAVAIIRDMVS